MPKLSANKAKTINKALEFNRLGMLLNGYVSADTYIELESQLNDSPPHLDNPNQKFTVQGNSLLNFMILQDNKKVTDILLSVGGDVNHKDEYGQTSLGTALTSYMKSSSSNETRTDASLLKEIIKMSSKDSLLSPDDNNEGTVFDMLSLRGINSAEIYQTAIDRFKELEPDSPIKNFVNVQDSGGNTVLHRLASLGQVDKMKMLTKTMSPEDKIESFNIANNDNVEPFFYAKTDDVKTKNWILGEMEQSHKLMAETNIPEEELKKKEEDANKVAAELEKEGSLQNEAQKTVKKKKRRRKKKNAKNTTSTDGNNDLSNANDGIDKTKDDPYIEAKNLGMAIDGLTSLLIASDSNEEQDEYLSKITSQIDKLKGYSSGLESFKEHISTFQVAGTRKFINEVIDEKVKVDKRFTDDSGEFLPVVKDEILPVVAPELLMASKQKNSDSSIDSEDSTKSKNNLKNAELESKLRTSIEKTVPEEIGITEQDKKESLSNLSSITTEPEINEGGKFQEMVKKSRTLKEQKKDSTLNANAKPFAPSKKNAYKPIKDKYTGIYVYMDKDGKPFQSSLDALKAYSEGISNYRYSKRQQNLNDNLRVDEEKLSIHGNSTVSSAEKGR